MNAQPSTVKEYIEELRAGLVCERCGRYVGSLAARRYLPPPYPVAIEHADDDEVESLIGFEWYMLNRLRAGNFVVRHPERDGRCISYREWLARDADDEADEGPETTP